MLPVTLTSLLLLTGCSEEKDPTATYEVTAAPVLGSRPMVPSFDDGALYATHTDEGILSRYDLATGEVQNLALGGRPSRVARVGNRVLVTLRAERAIVVLEEDGDGLTQVDRVATGAEPLGIVANADGTRVYVALWAQDEVIELDGDLNEIRRFFVEGHPSWLALHPSGRALYVGATLGGEVSWIDLDLYRPTAQVIAFPELIGAGDDLTLSFTQRVTGDLDVRADGGMLAAPMLYVNNKVTARSAETPPSDTVGQYALLGSGLTPNNPAYGMVSLDEDGHPASVDVLYGVGMASITTLSAAQVVRSQFASLQFSPDGALIYGAMEGSRAVSAHMADPSRWEAYDGGFVAAPGGYVGTVAGPRALAFVGDAAWVYGFLGLEVASFDPAPFSSDIASRPVDPDQTATALSGPGIPLTTTTLAADVFAGRALYYSAISPQFTLPATGVSCATCHFDGRADGLNWAIRGNGDRQTLSHAGPVSTTLPMTWTANIPGVANECRITSQVRLGGVGVTDDELAQVAAFIEFVPDVDTPDVDEAAAARGRALFERRDVGCTLCHNGPRLTDNQLHDIYGTAQVNTPGLINVATTAPYLHDGRAPTLRAVLETGFDRQMGNTSMLSEAELADLETYLRSL